MVFPNGTITRPTPPGRRPACRRVRYNRREQNGLDSLARSLRWITTVKTEEARPVRNRTRQRGFTLIEALVIAGIIGILVLITGVEVTNALNKSNLEGVGGEVRTFLESAKSAMVRENSAVTVRYQVVGGKPTLQLTTAAGAVLRAQTLPDYVKAAVNPGGTAPAAWPTPTPGNLFTCDTQGRTIGAAGAQVGTPQVVSLTHRGMVDEAGFGSVRPRMRYDIELFPLWTVGVTKRIY